MSSEDKNGHRMSTSSSSSSSPGSSNSSASISLQRIIGLPPSSVVELNKRNNNPSGDEERETERNGNKRSSFSNNDNEGNKGIGVNVNNNNKPTSSNPRAQKSKGKPSSASAAILEAKRKAQQAQKQRVTRSSAGNDAKQGEQGDTVPEVDIVVMKDHLQPARDSKGVTKKPTGVVYDTRMLEHECLWDPEYPEKPERLGAAIQRCKELGLLDRCLPIPPRCATLEEIKTVHTDEHIAKLKGICETNDVEAMENFSSHYDAVYIHPSTYELSLLASGCTVDLVDAVLDGKVQNGMALIRPPGHHAMKAEYCGYCFFNNVAVAAKKAVDSGKARKVLIVDFDVHHGQATQQMFYNDDRVLYFSTHRFENGKFWPNLKESDYNFIGSNDGIGFNCNVPLNKTGLGNADFLTIWHQLLLPLAYEFNPDLVIVSAGYDCLYGCFEFSPEVVLVSAGFDSLQGDEKGEMAMTPQCVPHLLWPLMGLAGGKVAVVLEGGYCVKSLAEGAALSLRALLGDPCPLIPKNESVSPVVADTILNCSYMLRLYWNFLKKQPVSNEETINTLEENGVLHRPQIAFEWNEPKQDIYLTRNCYPVQSVELKDKIDATLDSLIASTYLGTAKHRVGLVYDDAMLKHRNLQEPWHPETPERISNIFANHADFGLLERCERLNSRQATDEELLLIHSLEHIELMKKIPGLKKGELERMQGRWNSVFLNNHSYESAVVAAGSLLEVVDNVVNNNCQSGVAIIRPPGHHAEESYPCGFCVFNNVALAAKYALETHGLKRILIIDWDVHHGNGIQRMFESDPRVLYISIHRYDNGFFFPCSPDANYDVVGEGAGKGFNINVPWNSPKMGDTEYLSVFTNIVMPVAYEYNPELVLVSAGFDAAKGDPLGGCNITPEGYGHMTHMLKSLANGKVIIALEGGYNLTSIAYSMVLCTKALLGDPLPVLTLNKNVHSGALKSIQNVLDAHAKYWNVLKPFRKVLPHKKRLIPFGTYEDDEKPLEEQLAQFSLNANDTAGSGSEFGGLSSGALDLSTSSDRGNGISPSKQPLSPSEPLTMTLVLNNEELGACGGAEVDIQPTPGSKRHVIVMHNFEDSAPAAVYPITSCPHLVQIGEVSRINTSAACGDCGNVGDNWVCLTCFKVFCGRYVNSHMVDHSGISGHQLALSFADLSIWCYACESYVRHQKLFSAFRAAHIDKFNEDPPAQSFCT